MTQPIHKFNRILPFALLAIPLFLVSEKESLGEERLSLPSQTILLPPKSDMPLPSFEESGTVREELFEEPLLLYKLPSPDPDYTPFKEELPMLLTVSTTTGESVTAHLDKRKRVEREISAKVEYDSLLGVWGGVKISPQGRDFGMVLTADGGWNRAFDEWGGEGEGSFRWKHWEANALFLYHSGKHPLWRQRSALSFAPSGSSFSLYHSLFSEKERESYTGLKTEGDVKGVNWLFSGGYRWEREQFEAASHLNYRFLSNSTLVVELGVGGWYLPEAPSLFLPTGKVLVRGAPGTLYLKAEFQASSVEEAVTPELYSYFETISIGQSFRYYVLLGGDWQRGLFLSEWKVGWWYGFEPVKEALASQIERKEGEAVLGGIEFSFAPQKGRRLTLSWLGDYYYKENQLRHKGELIYLFLGKNISFFPSLSAGSYSLLRGVSVKGIENDGAGIRGDIGISFKKVTVGSFAIYTIEERLFEGGASLKVVF